MALAGTPVVPLAGILSEVKRILVEVGSLAVDPESIPNAARIFESGLGLNSLQGIELLVRIEDCFGVLINNLDWSVHEAQTVEDLGRYVAGLGART